MKLRFSDRAIHQLRKIRSFIAERNATSASIVIDRIRKAARRLQAWPLSGKPGALAGTREAIVPSQPYVIVYRLDRTGAEIEILAVYHTAQDRPR